MTDLPGSSGLPLVGESLKFLAGPYAFFRDRTATHGDVFRTHLLGEPCAVVSGPAAAALFVDHDKVQRERSQPPNVFALFAGPSVPHLDGDAHRDRKAILMQAFSRSALEGYLPGLTALVEGAFARWAGQGETRWMDELQRLSVEAVCGAFLGESGGPRVEALLGHYAAIERAFGGLPVKLPFTAYGKGLAALDEVLALFGACVRERREKPTDDGLSRMLGHTTASGARLDDDQAAREMHHMIMAGRIVWAHLATLILELEKAPALRARLDVEVGERAAGPLAAADLLALPYLGALVREVKRVSPAVPCIFGRAKQEITFGSHTIPKGWMLVLALRQSHEAGPAFQDPARFDPERFLAPRAEDEKTPNGFFPHGPGAALGSHHCAGTDLATLLTLVFAVTLSRGYRYELPAQDLGYDWRHVTPGPKDGLRARISKRG